MKLYEYDQNNSGGSFESNDEVTYTVYIEAPSESLANKAAEDFAGIYFNGADYDGPDCPCCGDRWFQAYDEVDLNGQPLEDFLQNKANRELWAEDGDVAVYHYDYEGNKTAYKKIGNFSFKDLAEDLKRRTIL